MCGVSRYETISKLFTIKKITTMSIIGGEFTETNLQNVRVMAERMAFDSNIKRQYEAQGFDVMNAVKAQQTAVISFGNENKDLTVDVEYMNACDVEAKALENCEPTSSPELSTNVKDLSLDQSRMADFKLKEAVFRTNDYDKEMALAKGKLIAESQLIDYIAGRAIVALNANAGVNQFVGGIGNVVGNTTFIDNALWDASLFAYLKTVMWKNRYKSASFISGNESLYTAWTTALFNAGNGEGKGAMEAFKAMPIFFDPAILEGINDPDSISYMLNQGVLAFASKPVFSQTPERKSAYVRWSEKSVLFPDLWINYQMWDACDDNSNYDVVKVKPFVHFDFLTAPTACDEDNTGILKFQAGVVS